MAVNPKLAAALAVRRNNQSQGSMTGLKKMLPPQGQGTAQNPEADTADNLQRIIGHSIVDHIMQKRAEAQATDPSEPALAHGGMVGPQEDEDEDFLDHTSDLSEDEYDGMDEGENETEPQSEDEDEEQKHGGRADLTQIFSALRKKHMGRR